MSLISGHETRSVFERCNIVAERDLNVDVEHVTDIEEIAKHGVMGMPVLMVNGEVKCEGCVPERKRIESWLLQKTS